MHQSTRVSRENLENYLFLYLGKQDEHIKDAPKYTSQEKKII